MAFGLAPGPKHRKAAGEPSTRPSLRQKNTQPEAVSEVASRCGERTADSSKQVGDNILEDH